MAEITSEDRITHLAKAFPTLSRLDIVKDWNANALDRWALSGVSHGDKLAVQFVLAVWNQWTEWECGHFDVVEAYGVWDATHWKAFQTWASDPFVL